MIAIATSGHAQRLVTDDTHAGLIFAFIAFCLLVTIAFKENGSQLG